MSYKKSDYSQKLLDPRWQRKRLEILQRDDFTCQVCSDKIDNNWSNFFDDMERNKNNGEPL